MYWLLVSKFLREILPEELVKIIIEYYVKLVPKINYDKITTGENGDVYELTILSHDKRNRFYLVLRMDNWRLYYSYSKLIFNNSREILSAYNAPDVVYYKVRDDYHIDKLINSYAYCVTPSEMLENVNNLIAVVIRFSHINYEFISKLCNSLAIHYLQYGKEYFDCIVEDINKIRGSISRWPQPFKFVKDVYENIRHSFYTQSSDGGVNCLTTLLSIKAILLKDYGYFLNL